MFYYRPTGEYAYHDIKYLDFDVPFGMFTRNMHRWAAHGMVIAAIVEYGAATSSTRVDEIHHS
jgi:quinol-cytochrome oxidoreductase complex cytochrome b subunit